MKDKDGITLIALVITIIVLLILAGVTVVTLTGDNGLLNRTSESVLKNREETEKEKVIIAWTSADSDYFLESANNSNLVKNAEFYENKLKKYLDSTGYDISVKDGDEEGFYVINYKSNDNNVAYNFVVNSDGNIAKPKRLEDYGVKFGDYVNYDEGSGYTYTTNPEECASKEWPDWSSTNYDLTQNGYVFSEGTFYTENLNWRVLGVSDMGNLELISEYPTSEQLNIGCKNGYINCEKTLNEFCQTLYGNGKFAANARSLKNEDIYKLREITEMNSTLYNGYGKKYQFRYENNDSCLKYRTASELSENWTEWNDSYYNSFYTVQDGLVVGINKRGTSDIFVCDFVIPYFWRGNDLIQQVIYCDSVSNSNSWLASKGIREEGDRISFAVSCTHSNATLYSSDNSNSCMNSWVRPVVTLKSDVIVDTLTTNGESANTAYKLK